MEEARTLTQKSDRVVHWIWITSFFITAIFSFGIAQILYQATAEKPNYYENPPLYSNHDVELFLQEYKKIHNESAQNETYELVAVKVGIDIKALYDITASSISFAGEIFLRYPERLFRYFACRVLENNNSLQEQGFANSDDCHLNGNRLDKKLSYELITEHFKPVLPEEIMAGDGTKQLISIQPLEKGTTFNEEDEIILRFHVESTLKQKFFKTKFPLEFNTLNPAWIRIWPHNSFRIYPRVKEYDDQAIQTIAIPEVDSYHIEPKGQFGIAADIATSWKIKETFWNLALCQNYNTTNGRKPYEKDSYYPDLYFNIVLDRSFKPVFIKYLSIPIAVLFILFATGLLIRDSKTAKFDITNASTVIISLISMVITITTMWGSILDEFKGSGTVYPEHYYMLDTIIVIFIILNAIAFSSDAIRENTSIWGKFFVYKNNLLPKVIILPLASGYLLLQTYSIMNLNELEQGAIQIKQYSYTIEKQLEEKVNIYKSDFAEIPQEVCNAEQTQIQYLFVPNMK